MRKLAIVAALALVAVSSFAFADTINSNWFCNPGNAYCTTNIASNNAYCTPQNTTYCGSQNNAYCNPNNGSVTVTTMASTNTPSNIVYCTPRAYCGGSLARGCR